MSLPAPELARIRSLAPVPGAWLVGGSVRDLLLGRPVTDVDLVVEADAGATARELARTLGGAPFPLSERHGAWRVVHDAITIDVSASRGSVAEDMGRRDFTINAMAVPLAGGELIDPYGGSADLDARRLRMVSSTVFDDDPLRLLRLARLAQQLALEIDPATADQARRRAARAGDPAGERVYMEMRGLLGLDDPAAGLRQLEELGLLDAVLPELAATREVKQSPFHALDVYGHTLQVVDTTADIAAFPEHYLPVHAAAIAAELALPVGDGLDGAAALAVRGALPRHPQASDPEGLARGAHQLHGTRSRGG